MSVPQTFVSQSAWRLILFGLGVLVLLEPLAAHGVRWRPGVRNTMIIEVGKTNGTITVSNGSNEGPCTTEVDVRFTPSGGTAAVDLSGDLTYRGGGGSSTTITVTPTSGGRGTMRVKWTVTVSGSNCNGTAPATTFPVIIVDADNPLMSNAGLDNTFSLGDPVSVATGELHDRQRLQPDLSLGGPLSLDFARYYGAFLTASGFDGALGNNWTHNFDYSVVLEADIASVKLFGGNTISFMRDGEDWALSSTEKLDHQLIDVPSGGYKFLDLNTERIYTFDSQGRLASIEDRNGNTLTVTQGANGPTMVSDGLGRSLDFTYTAGKLSQVQDHSGRTALYQYTGDNLTGFTDARGNATTYSYTAAGEVEGLLESTTRPDGSRPANQVFDGEARVTTQTDGEGGTTQFAYEQAPNESGATVTNALGVTTGYVHPDGQNLSRATNEAGASDATLYDANNRVIRYATPGGAVARFTYHEPSGFPETLTNFTSGVLRNEYAEQQQGGFRFYRVTRTDYPDGSTERYEWDANGNLTTLTDRAGDTTVMTYNQRGQATTINNTLGGTATIVYNDDGTPSEAVTPGGASRGFSYDDLMRPTRIRFGDGIEQSAIFNAVGDVEQTIDELGRTFRLEYDENDQLETGTDALGNSRRFAYDGNGRLTSEVDRTGRETKTAYDPVGNLAQISNDAGNSIRFFHEDRNLVSEVRDNLGSLATYTYDADGRVASATDPLGNTGALGRDAMGRVTRFTLPAGADYQFAYDALGRLTSMTNPVGRVRRNTYDPRGHLASSEVAGINARYDFNSFGGVKTITDPNGNDWRRGFDGGGRRTSFSDPLGRETRYSYDGLGRRTEVITRLGTIRRTYDPVGNLTQRTFDDGSLDYAYDDDDRLVSGNGVTLTRDEEGRIVDSNGIGVEYGPAGRIRKIRYVAGKEVDYAYDSRGRVVSVSDWAGGQTTLVYDAADHLVEIQRPNGVTTEMVYDANEWLTSVRHTGQSVSAGVAVERDEAGQVTSESVESPVALQPAGGVLSLSYDAAHQISDAEYDDRGRITSDRIRQYQWDGASRLVGYAGADGMAGFTYDALGNRISRTGGNAVESYAVNYAYPLPTVAVVRSNGADRRYYIHLPNGVLLHSIDVDGGRRFYHFDHTGTTQMLTSDAGAVTDAYRVTPFGEEVRTQGDSDQPYIYHGAYGVEWERGTSIYYMRQRYYDGAWGRFLSRDPVLQLDPLRMNPYLFAANNPLSFTDPTGLDDLPQFGSSTGPGIFSVGFSGVQLTSACDGVPNPVLDSGFISRVQNGPTGRRLNGGDLDGSSNDFVARGYITVDNASDCNLVFPNDPGFIGSGGPPTSGPDANQLWGDWFIVNSGDSAVGDSLVHIEAADDGPNDFGPGDSTFYGRYRDPRSGADSREPLGTTWGSRYVQGGGFDGAGRGAAPTIWRDTQPR